MFLRKDLAMWINLKVKKSSFKFFLSLQSDFKQSVLSPTNKLIKIKHYFITIASFLFVQIHFSIIIKMDYKSIRASKNVNIKICNLYVNKNIKENKIFI